MMSKKRFKIPKKLDLRNIKIELDHVNGNHYITAYCVEYIKTTNGKTEIPVNFKLQTSIKYIHSGRFDDKRPEYLIFKDYHASTLKLFLECHNFDKDIVVNFYPDNHSETLKDHGVSLESIIITDDKNTIGFNDAYTFTNAVKPFSPWWGTHEHTPYEDYDGIEL